MQFGMPVQNDLPYQTFSNLLLLKVSFYSRNAILWHSRAQEDCLQLDVWQEWGHSAVWWRGYIGLQHCRLSFQKQLFMFLLQYFIFNNSHASSDTHFHILCAISCPWLQIILWLPTLESDKQCLVHLKASSTERCSVTTCNQPDTPLSTSSGWVQVQQLKSGLWAVPWHCNWTINFPAPM